MGEVDKQPGPCLLCRSKDEPSFQDLPSHIRTNHTDQTPELIAQSMIDERFLN